MLKFLSEIQVQESREYVLKFQKRVVGWVGHGGHLFSADLFQGG
jgi:hypothetical protein